MLKIEHGQIFDNGSRWCANCHTTVFTCDDPILGVTTDKICHHCLAIWPEYEDEFFEDFKDSPEYQAIYGVGATWH